MIERLEPGMTGTYLVETQGSKHLWNLDEGWYIRNPGRVADAKTVIQEAFQGFTPEFTGTRQPLDEVVRWPEVGQVFYVNLPPPDHWHRSSRIRNITKVGATGKE